MSLENRNYSWITSVYWTVANMSTLGLGDITFVSDIGRLFNIFVSLAGLVFILVLVPFTFVQLFQSTERVHRELSKAIRDHVILTHYDYVSQALIKKLAQFNVSYFLLVPDINKAAELTDLGLKIVKGNLDDRETYRKTQIENALGVVHSGNQFVNTAATYAVRRVASKVQVIATADTDNAESVLLSAGATNVIKLSDMMGRALGRRITAGDALAHDIGFFDKLKIAEATVKGTPLVNKKLKETKLRELAGVSVVGIWNEGEFSLATADTIISNRSVLVLAGSQEQIDMYNEIFCIYNVAEGPVLIIGGGKVGRVLAKTLEERELDYKIIEKDIALGVSSKYKIGDASENNILIDAGLMSAPAAAITTADDSLNIFITTLIRKLKPDIQIISRASHDRTVELLYEAGCDFVMSYSTMGANSIFNLLKKGNVLMVAEGVDILRVAAPQRLHGKTIEESLVREKSGCSIVAIDTNNDIVINPVPTSIIKKGDSIIIIGTVEAEVQFFKIFVD